jgi:mannose-6-phosphate isomerase-like protein (cupin superfamily)
MAANDKAPGLVYPAGEAAVEVLAGPDGGKGVLSRVVYLGAENRPPATRVASLTIDTLSADAEVVLTLEGREGAWLIRSGKGTVSDPFGRRLGLSEGDLVLIPQDGAATLRNAGPEPLILVAATWDSGL